MSRNSQGVYTLPAGNPVVTGTLIESAWANGTLADVAAEITNSLDRAGRGAMTAPLKLFDGTAAIPGLSFSDEPTSGFSQAAAGRIGVSILGLEVGRWTANGLRLKDGTAPLPALAPISDTDTGIFFEAGVVALAGGGLEIARFTSVASAVNRLGFENAITAQSPNIVALGTDANIAIDLIPKGTGGINLEGVTEVTVPGTAGAATVGLIVGSVVSGTIGTESRLHIGAVEGAVRGVYIGGVNTNGAGNEHAMTFGVGASTSAPVERMRLDALGTLTVPGFGRFGANGATLSGTAVLGLSEGDYGGTGALSTANDLVIENSGSAGISIMTPNNAVGALRFGDPEVSSAGGIYYAHSADELVVVVAGGIGATFGSSRSSYVSDFGEQEFGFRGIPRGAGAGGTLSNSLRGTCYATTANVTISASSYVAGDAVSVYCNSATAITIIQGAGLTLRLAGTTSTGNRTLAARGFATIWFNAFNEAIISGSGVS